MTDYANDPNYPSIKPSPVKSPWLQATSNFLRGAKEFGNKAEIPQWMPLIGGEGVGDLLLGNSDREVGKWAMGSTPFSENRSGLGSKIPMLTDARKKDVADVVSLGMDVAPMVKPLAEGGKWAVKEGAKEAALHIANGMNGEGILAKPLAGVSPMNAVPNSQPKLTRMDMVDGSASRKPISEMTDAELEAFGKQYGVDFSQSEMVPMSDIKTRKTIEIPGGLDGKFSYPDLHRLKASAIDPNSLSDELHAELQKKMLRSTTPEKLNDNEVFARTVMGLTSPNTPLLANQFQVAALRARNPGDFRRLASYVGDEPSSLSAAQRRSIDEQIGLDFGMQGQGKGGMGIRSSADLTNVAELARNMEKFPEYYYKKGDETWQEAAERIANIQRGLSAKTGSFGVVWQNPGEATTSAMDRHMARNYFQEALKDPALKKDWESRWHGLYNTQVDTTRELAKQLRSGAIDQKTYLEKMRGLPPEGSKKVRNFAQLDEAPGSLDWQLGRVEQEVAQHQGGKYRMANGEINPRVPEHLRNMPQEPKDFFTFGDLYKNMLNTNEKSAGEHGLNVFGEQWRKWDRIRGQIEPHESMYPGLDKLPKLSNEELKAAFDTQKRAGFASSNGAVKQYDWKKGFYYGLPVGAVGLAASKQEEPETY